MTLPPTHWYRYQTCARLDWLKPLLLNHEIYFPTATQLNDPAECRPRIKEAPPRDLARFMVRMWSNSNPRASLAERADVFRKAHEGILQQGPAWMREEITKELHSTSTKTRILSLSKRWNNMGLWANYADDHRGYCLEFANVEMFAGRVKEVVYGDSIDLDVTSPTVVPDSLVLFYRKTKDWNTEEEARIVGPTIASPFIKLDPSWLTRIILGKEMKPDHRRQICEWARLRTPPLVVAQATYDTLEQTLRLV